MSVESAFPAVGLAHEVCLSAEGQGYTPELLNALAEHVIDLDAAPFNPWEKDGGVVEEHQKGGQWKFDPTQVKFHLADGLQGHKLRKAPAGQPVWNANVLDYLLAHPELIPEDWEKTDENGNPRYILFRGTVYRRRDGDLIVRCLCWAAGEWGWALWLESD